MTFTRQVLCFSGQDRATGNGAGRDRLRQMSFKRSDCAIACALDVIGDKWRLLIPVTCSSAAPADDQTIDGRIDERIVPRGSQIRNGKNGRPQLGPLPAPRLVSFTPTERAGGAGRAFAARCWRVSACVAREADEADADGNRDQDEEEGPGIEQAPQPRQVGHPEEAR